MKKLFTLMIFAGVLLLSACSDSDEETPLFTVQQLNKSFGKDEGTTLKITYSKLPLVGKYVESDVHFHPDNTKSIILRLSDIIPGQRVTLPATALTESDGKYAFSGSTVTTRSNQVFFPGATITYSGTISDVELVLDLDVTIPDVNGRGGNYRLAEFAKGDLDYGGGAPRPGVPVSGAFYIDWSTASSKTINVGKAQAVTFRGILGIVLPQLLKCVSLERDGNISVQYSSDKVECDPSMINSVDAEKIAALVAKKTFHLSPKNLAYWHEAYEFEFDGDCKLYVKLNIPAIVAQIFGDNENELNEELAIVVSKLLEGDPEFVKPVIRQWLGVEVRDVTLDKLYQWMMFGVPFHIKAAEGHTYLYLDKSDLDMFFIPDSDGTNDFTRLMTAFSSKLPVDYQMFTGLLGMISTYWPETETFRIGLDLVKETE